jgi:hypothetical protein
MNRQKIIITLALGLVAAVLTSSNAVLASNLNQAVNTLPQNDEWAIMAYAAMNQNVGQNFLKSSLNGSNATDYEKRILAITAQGQDPRNFGSENFVEKLKSFFDGTQIGDPSLLNDDIFGLLALSSAGEQGNIINQLRSHILSRQNSNGGFGFGASGSDSNTTAMAVAALRTAGSAPSSAVAYLLNSQSSSGGFGFTPGTAPDGASTAWVISGLIANGTNVPASAISYLESLQMPDGSFKWQASDSTGSSLITAYAVIALSGHTLPIRTINPINPPPSPTPTPTPTPTPNPSPTPTPSPTPNPSPSPTPSPNPIPSDCRVRVFHTDFAFPPEGGKIVKVGDELYFIKTYLPGCGNVGGTPVPSPSPSPTPTPTPTPNPSPTPTPTPVPPPPPANFVNVSVNYNSTRIFSGNVTPGSWTALSALQTAGSQGNFNVDVTNTSLGPYVRSIAGFSASGSNGWQYAVNGNVPAISAGSYTLSNGNRVQWFYGPPNTSPY